MLKFCSFYSFLIGSLLSIGSLKAQDGEDPKDLDPQISARLLASYQKVYDKAAEQSTTQRWLIGQRMELLADPLNLHVHKILRRSKIAQRYLPEAMDQTRLIIWESLILHQDGATLAIPGADGQLQDLLKHVQRVASVFPFTKKARETAAIFGLPGEVNAYTTSGDVARILAVFFDPLRESMDEGNMNQIIAHELAHILFGHIPDRILLNLVFYATAKNLIPEEYGEEPQDERTKKDKKDLRASAAEFLDVATDHLVRELIPHAGKDVDKNPLFRNNLRQMVETMGNKIAAQESKESLVQLSSSLIRAVRGLNADEPVEITKEAEKQFKEDLRRFSRSCETSCDRAGYMANRLLGDKDHHKSSVMAYVKLVGSSGATYEGTKQQIRKLHEQTIDPELRARFRDVGSSHPNSYARAYQFEVFQKSEPYRILSDQFLTALTDYIALTRLIIDLRESAHSPEVQELYDRVSTEINREALVGFAIELSDWIQEAVVDELQKVQTGKSKNVSATVVLLETLIRIVDEGAESGMIPSLEDLRDEQGKPKRLFHDLAARLRALDKATRPPQPLPEPPVFAGTPPSAVDALKKLQTLAGDETDEAGAVGLARPTSIYAMVAKALELRIPHSGLAEDVEEIIKKAKGCKEAAKKLAKL
jgi:hypothetical protein